MSARLALRQNLAWIVMRQAVPNAAGVYHCPDCKLPLTYEMRPRSLWNYPFAAGGGSVVPVLHVFCPTCSPEFLGWNELGAKPVLDIELIAVNEYLMPEDEGALRAADRFQDTHARS